MSKKVRSLLLVAVLMIMTVVLCACKDGTSGNEDKDTPNGSSDGGTIIVGITQDLDSLDPHKTVGAGTKEILYNIFDGLVKSDENGNFYAAVASDYSISEDGMRYSFVLREGVKFHNGEPVTKADVVYSLKRCAGLLETSDPEVRTISAFSIISDVVETDKGVDILLSRADTELIGYFTCGIVPKDYADQATKPIGAGPFKFVSYSPLQSIVLEKNEDYYVEGIPHLDKVTFKISANADSAFFELLSGNIDIFPYLTEEQASKVPDSHNVQVGELNMVQALFLNHEVKPFDDVRVRQAMCYAIDRKLILDMVAGGKGEIIGSNMFPSYKKYYDESLVDTYAYNIEEARRLLAEAGYPDGFEFTIKVPSNYQFHVETAEVIVELLKKVNISANIQLIEWASWLSDVYKGSQFEATVVGLDSQLAPSDVLRFYPSDSSRNFINYINPEFDKKLNEAKATVDEEEKAKLYKELQQILTSDAAAVYIQSPAQQVAVSKKLKGYLFFPIFVQDVSTVYFAE